jgi:hypothetical protein
MRQIHAFLRTRDGVKQYFLSLFCYRNFRTGNVGFEIGIAGAIAASIVNSAA